MLNAAECMAKAYEMEAEAVAAPTPILKAHYHRMVAMWRELAAVAATQQRLAKKS